MEKDKKIKVGDYVYIGDRLYNNEPKWREVLAARTPIHCDYDTMHIAYASEGRAEVILFMGESQTFVTSTAELEAVTYLSGSDMVKHKFGSAYDVAERTLDVSCNLKGYGGANLTDFIHGCHTLDLSYDSKRPLFFALDVYEAAKDGKSISLFLTVKDKRRDRRTTMKAGRAFRHMFPTLDDKRIAALTEDWIEQTSERELILKVGGDAAAFKQAYNGTRASYRNPKITKSRKSLATSCIHDVDIWVDGDNMSPAEVYASGDFKVAWLETVGGYVAGRVVFSARVGTKQTHAPIYGACEQSLDILQDYLDTNGIEYTPDQGEWDGLWLRKVEDDNGRLVGPYLDGELLGEDMDTHIALRAYCSSAIRFDGTDGYASQGDLCVCCGDVMAHDTEYHTDDGTMCECCFGEHYTYTYDGCIISTEDACGVYAMVRGQVISIAVHVDDSVYCEPCAEYWHIDDVIASDCGEYVPYHARFDYPELFPAEEEEAA